MSERAKIRFGVFEADLQSEELRKAGSRIKIQSQPFKVLSVLLERPGEVVSRDELQQRLWGNQTTVDFDHGLGTAINKLREALGDSADNPRFIETLSRRGYRFIAPVNIHPPVAPLPHPAASDSGMAAAAAPTGVASPETDAPANGTSRIQLRFPLTPRLAILLFGLLVGMSGALLWLALRESSLPTPPKISQVTYSGRVFPGEPLQENFAALATDGSRIYFPQLENARTALAQALIADGETSPLPLPSEIAAPSLGNISPDGSRLLVRSLLAPKAEQPIWIVPTLGGTARMFSNILAHDATWMPDGQHILYASGRKLLIAGNDGSGLTTLASLPGRAFWLRWSPDGKKLRFTLLDSLNHSSSLWEIAASGRNLHPLLPNWSAPASECCGNWTADGKYFVFQSAHSGMNNIWALKDHGLLGGLLPSRPIQVTNGPLSYQAPVTARAGEGMFFIGLDTRSLVLKFDVRSGQFVPYGKPLTAAELVEFSRDGSSMAWINPEDSSLWRSRVDGSQQLQLTAKPLEVFMMHWSPDGKRILLMGREPGKLWRIYIVDAQGGNLAPVLNDTHNEADPDWSPDGSQMVFGRLPDLMAEKTLQKFIYIYNLKTRQTTTVPGSEGLFSPRWSPDGHSIVAMPLDQSRLVLYDTTTQMWKTLIDRPAHDPVWSHDGRWIYFHDFLSEDQSIYRVAVPDGHLEKVAGLQSLQPIDALDFRFAGLTPDDIPIVNARISTANIYSMDLNK